LHSIKRGGGKTLLHGPNLHLSVKWSGHASVFQQTVVLLYCLLYLYWFHFSYLSKINLAVLQFETHKYYREFYSGVSNTPEMLAHRICILNLLLVKVNWTVQRQQLHTRQREHPSSTPLLCVVLCRPLLGLFYNCLVQCLSFNLRLKITPLVSSTFFVLVM
jgi:hypothetical protein